ncbi:peptide deformylase [Rhodococcus sp. H29-C3]|uniref:peptide deformylase n=1 Tax=Rhodococcus sp. H29-C3 TaxID=3046307 RepID=UPI0024B9AE0E|nr:peptide deformylase [Rhodococcus sp. H29-C3]MDJ0361031.1 peptide deformylase [Rhodococcus sp. H29-C3]
MPVSELLRLGNARPIARWGTSVLHTPARPVTDFGSELQELLADMFATNTAADGAGLAAQQVGIGPRRIHL